MLKLNAKCRERIVVYPGEEPTVITNISSVMARLGFEGDSVVMRESLVGAFDVNKTARQDAIIRLLAILDNKELDELEQREVDYVRERFLTGRSC